MTQHTPKAFDFGAEPELPAEPAGAALAPQAFDFGDAEQAAAAPAGDSVPRALSFDELPAAPPSAVPSKAAARVLFESEDHPAVRDALAIAQRDHPALFEPDGQRLAALFRRLLPIRLSVVAEWAERPLMEQAALLQPITELVLAFTRMAVPALLESALESTRTPAGVFDKLFRRPAPPAQFKPALASSRAQLLQLIADSDAAMRELEASAANLALHAAALAVASTLAGGALDATLSDALIQRRTLIQQAVRQAELSILQMGQVRQQAAELVGQVSSFLTVTLPALEMAQAQGGTGKSSG
ncbi:hypothetical protein MasN3_09100 [Massilia varians]|uniref:Uncharacterized protein n=1 Tax=Massilia varians TaxID=457921 RepID=A0ABN6TB36_9BURK|nr:hypothetical protein [Massilia varians]BDT57416.1 hypothetical protein MasN3_09100 [Massilia varians]